MLSSLMHHHHYSRLTSTLSHLGWGWTGCDCPRYPSFLRHMLLHSQQVHILYHTITPLFPRPSYRPLLLPLIYPTSPNTHTHTHTCALLTCPNHLILLCLNLTERSSTPHISATSLLDLLSSYLTPAMYLSILRSHLHRTSISLLVNAHVSAPYIRADLTRALFTLPLVLSSMLQFTNKLAISVHLLHVAVTLAHTALSTPD